MMSGHDQAKAVEGPLIGDGQEPMQQQQMPVSVDAGDAAAAPADQALKGKPVATGLKAPAKVRR
jgi:hypothetical protein